MNIISCLHLPITTYYELTNRFICLFLKGGRERIIVGIVDKQEQEQEHRRKVIIIGKCSSATKYQMTSLNNNIQ